MAERRMFAKTIIDSDAFLDMPQSSQLLYFHLSMRADDEGFINNPRSIMRNVRCTEEDILQLINKKFIIPFKSGIVAIKHWKIHNYIRSDRFKATKYQEEKATLFLDENKAYTQNESKATAPCMQSVCGMDTNGIPTAAKMDTQDRLGKDRLGKDSIGKREKENKERETQQAIIEKYHSLSPSLPPFEILSDSIEKDLAESIAKYDIEKFDLLFTKAEASDFLKGENERNWIATFDWLIKSENIAKVLNGNFDTKKKSRDKTASYDLEAYEKMLDAKDNPPKTAAEDESIKARAEALQKEIAEKY